MSDQDQLEQFCIRLGATADQAKVMAAQLLKRAEQLARERSTTREGELQQLLELVTRGRNGEVPKDFVPPPPRPPEP